MPIDRGPFNALVDDDGSNTIGTVWNKSKIQGVILDPADAAFNPAVQTTVLVGTQNNFVLTSGSMFLTLFCNNATDLLITGIVPWAVGQRLRIVSIGAGHVYLGHQYVASIATNRLMNACTSAATPLAAGVGSAEYQYDGTAQRWRLAVHQQGAPIPYAMVWTAQLTNPVLGNGNIAAAYILSGRSMDVFFQVGIGSTTTQGSGLWLFSLPIALAGTPPVGSGFVTSSGGTTNNPVIITITGFVHPAGDMIGVLTSNGGNVQAGTPAGMTTNDVFRGAAMRVPVA